jgi:lipid II:glycine glycyltransferase (peptidoglycan interpeptide bridge formation enzyme)
MNCETRKEHGLPPQPYLFFKKLHEHVLSRYLGFVALATHQGREIAGAVYLYSREKASYKYGASLRSAQHLRANNLLMWKAIQRCSEQGYKRFCFGRTELEHAGLRQFKAGWGAEEKIIDYYKYDLRKKQFIKSSGLGKGLHTEIYKRMPIVLSKMIGRVLYRHVG